MNKACKIPYICPGPKKPPKARGDMWHVQHVYAACKFPTSARRVLAVSPVTPLNSVCGCVPNGAETKGLAASPDKF